ncbi:helix-turn-helix domain-containing protein [Pontiella sp.]|uniref:helix-turn-helix domain-containing protein n=2 Tax=Pontiella sp. TaxID=2837462 RepID=UPI00356256EB
MEQASLNIGTIGQRLEAARHAKGVSVSEAGQATKILSKFIEAMESDDFGALSAPVYAKSFIKMYASYLGLDPRSLVSEYVAQHAPKAKTHITDEVRQKLAKADQLPAEKSSSPATGPKGNGKAVFSEVNAAIENLSDSGLVLKIAAGVVGVLVLVGIVFSVKECSTSGEEAPAASGAAMSERRLITQDVPDVYLVEPGKIEVDR